MENPPVRLAKIVVGDPAFGSDTEFKVMPTVRISRRLQCLSADESPTRS
jgi:hypothetical protein